jgi:hypothetical protein
MTVTREPVPPRKPFSSDPLAGTVDDRLARLPEIVTALRGADPAAERNRVLQYDAVEAIRRTGSGCQPSSADPPERCATCCPP